MKKLSKTQMVVEFLKENQGKKFTGREIAESIVARYPDTFAQKRQNYADEKAFIQQIIAETSYNHLTKFHHLIKRGKDLELKTSVYWYEESLQAVKKSEILQNNLIQEEPKRKYNVRKELTEYDLYPLLITYLNQELDLYCLRIDEKTSSNTNGKGANKWLHPDIVAMKAIDQDWDSSVKECMKQSSSQNVKLFSFEVKKELNISNVRESFFQTVSNSSWANEGYLVATSIDKKTMEELRVLSALHGIGVILLDNHNLEQSKIIFPAKHRFDVDWQSVNRIVNVNQHFKEYIDYVSVYYKTGKIFKSNWNK